MANLARVAVGTLMFTALTVTLHQPALAHGKLIADGVENAQSTLHLRRRTESDAEQLKPESMLTDLRDTRLCLNELKQQAVNLFQEATRTLVTVNEPPLEHTPNTIHDNMLNEKSGKYIPPRKEWLVFYINTLEPIVHLLTEDIQDVDTNGRNVPKTIEDRINPLWKTWRADLLAINKSLDEVQGFIGEDSAPNIPLAKAAIDIWERAEELEKVRYKVAVIFREEYSKTAQAEKESSPKSK
jgi:hypothetical protein